MRSPLQGFFKRSKKRRRKKVPERRFVYLMERVSGRSWKTVFTLKREIKIGVAKDSLQRHRQVDSGIPGRVVLIYERKVDRATTVEASLHRRFAKNRLPIRGGKRGSGQTEFFRLSNSQIREAKRILNRKQSTVEDWVFVLIAVALIIFTIFNHVK